LFKIASCFSKEVSQFKPLWNKTYRLENKKGKEEFGINYHSLEESLRDMVPSMIEHGYLSPKKK